MTYSPEAAKVVGPLRTTCPCEMTLMLSALPPKQALYDPQFEHDACGVGFVVDIAGRKSNEIVRRSLQVLVNLQHRGATGCEANTGDGAGILIQVPHEFLKAECLKLGFNLPAPG